MKRYNRTSLFLEKIAYELDVLKEDGTAKPQKPECFLSKEQVAEHFDEHYLKYVEGYKTASRSLSSVSYSDKCEYRSVLLDLSFNYNGVILHENYFNALGKSEMSNSTKKEFEEVWGSVDKFKEALHGAVMASKGGWAVVGYDTISDQLALTVLDQHDLHGMLFKPILAPRS